MAVRAYCQLSLWLLAVQLASLVVFLRAYFPMKTPLPGYARRELDEQDMRPVFDRFVVVLVDALRADFMFGESSEMSFVNRMRQSNEAFSFVANAQIPTVTMPRIKAITTGSVPGFFDIAANLDSPALRSDSIILQLANGGKRLELYGDDTWLKLFPEAFQRADGTSSFFVADFTEVDDNVTRHVDDLLSRTNWDGAILHYLGVDHIGHLAGPSCPLLAPKLREMDAVIERLYAGLAQSDANRGTRTMLMVLGDHGMTEQGNHGGNSALETQTALLIISPDYARGTGAPYSPWPSSVNQVDLAPTLSRLLGLPIPQDNIGVMIQALLARHLQPEEHLVALRRNAEQILALLRQSPAVDQKRVSQLEARLLGFNGVEMPHHISINQYGERASAVLDYSAALGDYTWLLNELHGTAVTAFTGYDIPAMCFSIAGLAIAAAVSLYYLMSIPAMPLFENIAVTPIFSAACGFLATQLFAVELIRCLFPDFVEGSLIVRHTGLALLLHLPLAALLGTSARIQNNSASTMSNGDHPGRIVAPTQVFLLVAAATHAGSMFATSFVEEEHQTLYYTVSTLHLLQFVSALRTNPKAGVHALVLLTCARVLRSYNQTGDKWRHLPDTRSVLVSREYNELYTALVVVAPMTPLLVSVKAARDGDFVYLAAACCAVGAALLYRLIDADLAASFSWAADHRIFLARVSYGAIAVMLTRCITGLFSGGNNRSAWKCLGTFTALCLLLHRTHNIVLIPLYGVQLYALQAMTRQHLSHHCSSQSQLAVGTEPQFKVSIDSQNGAQRRQSPRSSRFQPSTSMDQHITPLDNQNNQEQLRRAQGDIYETITNEQYFRPWLATIFTTTFLFGRFAFFCQGNSNSPSTIDISGAYTGMRGYAGPEITGALTAIITFTGVLYWASAWPFLLDGTGLSRSTAYGYGVLTYQAANSIALVGITAAVLVQRHHLFVWSVMAPKLLYSAMETVIVAVVSGFWLLVSCGT